MIWMLGAEFVLIGLSAWGWEETLAGEGVCLIADRVGVAPGGGGLWICPGVPVVGENRVAFLENGLRLLLTEPHELARL